MQIPENNTIIQPDPEPAEIQERVSEKIIAKLDATHPAKPDVKINTQPTDNTPSATPYTEIHTNTESEQSDSQLLGLATDEQRVLKFIKLHNPNDKYFLNWNNIFTLGELYYSNYSSEEYRMYQNKLKLLAAKYTNPKRFILKFDDKQVQAFHTNNKSTDISPRDPIDKVEKPTFLNAFDEINNGYVKLSQMRTHLENTYKFLSGMPYIEPSDKKKFVKLRNNFIHSINAYYTYMYYFNRINNYIMSETEITLPHMGIVYSDLNNQMLPRIDKVTIHLSEDVINQKYNNEVAKLELYLAVKQKIQEQSEHPKDKKIQEELHKLMKEYIEFDKLYQTKLLNHIANRKNKKIICDMVILEGQPLPGDGAVTNPNEGLTDSIPSSTNLSALGTSGNKSSNGVDLDEMDDKERKRKFFFINKARRERGDF